MDRAFVDAKREFAHAAGAQVLHGALDLFAEIEHALGIAGEEMAGVGELAGARAAREEGFADPLLELADGDADGGLGAEEFLRGAGEAAFAGDGEEDVEFGEIQWNCAAPSRLQDKARLLARSLPARQSEMDRGDPGSLPVG